MKAIPKPIRIKATKTVWNTIKIKQSTNFLIFIKGKNENYIWLFEWNI